MTDDKHAAADDDCPPKESKTRGLFEDVARAIGRTAGRTKDAFARLGERGVTAVATKRLEHERSARLEELGRLARKALAGPEGRLQANDPRVAEIIRALDRLDEKLARMRGDDEKGGSDSDETGKE